MSPAIVSHQRLFLAALRCGIRTAAMEAAAFRKFKKAGYFPFEDIPLSIPEMGIRLRDCIKKKRCIRMTRMCVQFLFRPDLADLPEKHDGYAVCNKIDNRQVMSYKQTGQIHFFLEMLQKVKSDDFVKSFGPLLDYYKENGTANEGQDNQWSFKYSDGVFAAKTKENKCAELASASPFKVQYDYETASFTNENRVTLEFTVEDIKDAAAQENIQRIVDTYASREEAAHFSHLAKYDEIVENDYNLSVSTYVEAEDTREVVDIAKLNAEIEAIVKREDALREAIRQIIAEIEG